MKNRKIVSKHILADRIPLICAAVWMLAGVFGPGTVVSVLADPLYETDPDMGMLIYCAGVILVSLLALFLFQRWFYPEYEGSLKIKDIGRGFLCALPVIIYVIAYRVFKNAAGYEIMYPADPEAVLKGCRPGFNEEVFFRGIAAALLLRKYNDRKNIWFPAVITGVLFGLFHLTNITSMEELEYLWLGIVFTTVAGILFGLIFTLSGSLWSVIFLHSLYDILAMVCEYAENMPDAVIYAEVLIFFLFMTGYLIFVVRHSAYASSLWKRKWSIQETN